MTLLNLLDIDVASAASSGRTSKDLAKSQGGEQIF
jgi:hypothetical protein